MRSTHLLLGLTLSLLLAGCASSPDGGDSEDPTANWTVEEFYEQAHQALLDENYQIAIQYFEDLESRFPFGPIARQAQLEASYAYYKYDEPDSALSSADRFIRMNPRHPNVDYAFYLKGLVNFHRGLGLLDRYIDQDPSERDPGAARQAFYDFSELLKRFPESRYARDARQRMIYLRNNLAGSEMHAARYYMAMEAYVAALGRTRYVLANYAHSPAVEDALVTMTQAYLALDMRDLAADSLRVLRLNFPDNLAIVDLEAALAEDDQQG